jgi:hypothetical protein
MIQRQIHSYPEGPGVKAASALKSTDVFYYFDKGLLCKFRSVVGVCTYFENDVVDAILILDYQSSHRIVIAGATLFDQNTIVNADICSVQERFSSDLDNIGLKNARQNGEIRSNCGI